MPDKGLIKGIQWVTRNPTPKGIGGKWGLGKEKLYQDTYKVFAYEEKSFRPVFDYNIYNWYFKGMKGQFHGGPGVWWRAPGQAAWSIGSIRGAGEGYLLSSELTNIVGSAPNDE